MGRGSLIILEKGKPLSVEHRQRIGEGGKCTAARKKAAKDAERLVLVAPQSAYGYPI